MSKRITFNYIRQVIAVLAVAIIIIQGQALTFSQSATKEVDVVPAPEPSPTPEPVPIDGVLVNTKSTQEVNAFLGGNAQRSKFLTTLADRGVDANRVNYISVSADPNADASSDLNQLTNTLNDAAAKCGGPKVNGVDVLIGGYQHANGALDGEVLLVANLANGDQKLVAAFQADESAMAGLTEPVGLEGDFFPSVNSDVPNILVGCPPTFIAVIVCWIRCIFIQQILIILRCVVVTIVTCVFIPPFLLCFKTRIIVCRLIIVIRTIIICFINCVVVLVRANSPSPITGHTYGLAMPKMFRGIFDQSPDWLKKPIGQSLRDAMTLPKPPLPAARS